MLYHWVNQKPSELKIFKSPITHFIAILAILFSCESEKPRLEQLSIPDNHWQVILVTTENDTATAGTLICYDRTGDGWTQSLETINVTIGRSGLAWGQGLHMNPEGEYQKREGDGKSPAGIFLIGNAFGYDENPLEGSKLAYKQCTERDYFVDDPNSEDYNQWVSLPDSVENNPKEFWNSFERMKLRNHQYSLGAVVNHNMSPVQPGKGSAIFIHIWEAPGIATSGCTAMETADLEKLLKWIDPSREPILVQSTIPDFHKLKFQ